MSDLDALLAGIVADPHNQLRWLIVADWLDDHGQCDRAELLRLHRELIRTCCEPNAHPERAAWQTRIVELIDAGVKPCLPQHTLTLPGGVPLVGNFIPTGSFLMGSDVDEDEKPVHKVTITKGFFMGIYPVTQLQSLCVMGIDPFRSGGNEIPENHSSWEDAVKFCDHTREIVGYSVRLPTEAEWEYACRTGTTTCFHYGPDADLGRMNYNAEEMGDTGLGKTSVVGSYAPNPWGLFDCHGNVLEWCADLFVKDYYATSPEHDPEPQGRPRWPSRVLRGGHFDNYPENCRASRRFGAAEGRVSATVGFRVVFTLS